MDFLDLILFIYIFDFSFDFSFLNSPPCFAYFTSLDVLMYWI